MFESFSFWEYYNYNERRQKMTILRLEKRGCDFRKDSKEAKVSDLTNFRLCGIIKSDLYNAKHKRVSDYFIEICSNIQNNKFRNGMY